MKFVLDVELADERYCDGCPALDEHRLDKPLCRAGKFLMQQERIGISDAGYGVWRVPRPKGCPLRKVEEQ